MRLTSQQVQIIGGGTYTLPMFELARAQGLHVETLWVRGQASLEHMDAPIVRRYNDLAEINKGVPTIVAIGSPKIRQEVHEYLASEGTPLPTLVHPSAYVSPSATLEDGVYIHQFASVWSGSILQRGAILSPQSSVAHHSHIGRFCLISTNASIGAGIRVGPCCFVGMSATITTGVKRIAEETTIGAGATVLKNIDDPSGTYVGTPAIRKA